MTMVNLPPLLLFLLLPVYAGYLVIAGVLWLGMRCFDRPGLRQLGFSLAVATVSTVLVVLVANVAWFALLGLGFQQVAGFLGLAILFSTPVQLLAPPLLSAGTYALSKYRGTQKSNRPPKEEPSA